MAGGPSISILLATYDRPKMLTRALASIHRQTFRDWELILIADGPPDPNTLRVIERFALRDDRIRWVCFRRNSCNPARRLNQAMALARADLLAFQDDDDLWYPDALADLYRAYHEDASFDLYYGTVNFMDARTGACFAPRFGEDYDYERFWKRNLFCNNAVLLKRSAVDAVGGYDESDVIKVFYDWDLWLRIGAKFRMTKVDACIGEVWAYHPDSVGQSCRIDYMKIDARLRSSRALALKGYWSRPRRVLFLTHGHHPSLTLWRIDFLVEAVNRGGSPWRAEKRDLEDPDLERRLDEADVVVLYRFHRDAPGVRARQAAGLKVIYDLDDDLLDDSSGILEEDRKAVQRHIVLADAVTVSTPRLRKAIRRPNVFTRPNGIPRRIFQAVDAMDDGGEGDRFVAGWLAGVNPNDPEEEVVAMARHVARRLPGAGFYYLGKSEALHAALTAIPDLCVIRDPHYIETDDLGVYYARLKAVGIRCILAPLENDPLNAAKSEVKFIDSAVLRVPLVVSPVGVFRDLIRPWENGVLAGDPEAFAEAVVRIASDPDLARRMADTARREVWHRFDIDHVADRYLLDLNAVLDRSGIDAAMGEGLEAGDTPDLSVVIVNWNIEDLIAALLQSLREHPFSGGWEVIVVDNGSWDGSRPRVERDFPEVKLIRNAENLGYAAGNNMGIRASTGRYVLLLNTDTEVRPGTLDAMVRFLEEHPAAGAVSARLVNPDGSLQPSCMRFPTLATALVHDTFLSRLPFGRRHHRRYLMRDFDHAAARIVDQVPGTCMMMPRRTVEEVGFLDEGLFLYFNDVDLCRRLADAGRPVHFLSGVEVMHHGAASVTNYPDQVLEWHLNRIAYYRKHYGRPGKVLTKAVAAYAVLKLLLRIVVLRRGPRGKTVEVVRQVVRGFARVLRA